MLNFSLIMVFFYHKAAKSHDISRLFVTFRGISPFADYGHSRDPRSTHTQVIVIKDFFIFSVENQHIGTLTALVTITTTKTSIF